MALTGYTAMTAAAANGKRQQAIEGMQCRELTRPFIGY